MRNAIFLINDYICEELRKIFCIIHDGVTWTLCSGYVLDQYVLINKILYDAYGCVFLTLCQRCPCLGCYLCLIPLKEEVDNLYLPFCHRYG